MRRRDSTKRILRYRHLPIVFLWLCNVIPASASLLKIIGVNLLVLFVLGNVLYWSIPTVGAISDYVRGKNTAPPTTQPALNEDVPIKPGRSFTADDAVWMPAYLNELSRHRARYVSYVGWRSEPLDGKALTIGGQYHQRQTVNTGARTDRKAYFFGGSTMWGAWSNNAGTIPSQFAAITGIHAENFGELGWTAHQSLVLLIQLLQDGHRPDLVVFYDGVNDTSYNCRHDHPRVGAHAWEHQLNERIYSASVEPGSFAHYAAPLVAIAAKVRSELSKAFSSETKKAIERATCSSSPDKVEAIAESVSRDWRLAKQLVEAHGGRFLGFLQPVAYLSRVPTDELSLPENRSKDFNAVYAALRRKAAENDGFHDLVTSLDGDQHVYVDECHLAPAGNRRIAQKIADVAVPLLAQR